MNLGDFGAWAVGGAAYGVPLPTAVLDELAVDELVLAVLDETGHAQTVAVLATKHHHTGTERERGIKEGLKGGGGGGEGKRLEAWHGNKTRVGL